MKTYYASYALLALVILGCSKSDEGSGGEEKQKSIDADYALVLTKGANFTTQLLNANAEVLTMNPEQSALEDAPIPDLTAVNGTKFLQYHTKSDGSGKITKHDFKKDEMSEIDLFDDLKDSTLHVNAITFSDAAAYIAYDLEIEGEPSLYRVRVLDMMSSESSFEDVVLNKKPLSLSLANNRLFILTLDEEVSDENALSVMDLSSNNLIHEMNLGFDAKRIFTNMDNDIIISYDELHTTLDSNSLSFLFTNYGPGTEPKFTAVTSSHFDLEGKLYYPVDSGIHSVYPEIPAVYDFNENLMVLYAYENFLTEAKRDFEFEIETTTTVNYDEKNGLMLIGYKKKGSAEGGLLRIKPIPEPAFFDNIDLDGVPYEIFIN